MSINVHVIECTVDPSSAPDMVGQHWINTATGCHFLSNGTASVANWIKINDPGETTNEVTILPSATENLQITALVDFCAIKYHICVFSIAQNKWKSLMLHASKVTSTTVEDSVYSILGGPLDIDANFSVVVSDGVLAVTNNEAFSVTVRFRSEII